MPKQGFSLFCNTKEPSNICYFKYRVWHENQGLDPGFFSWEGWIWGIWGSQRIDQAFVRGNKLSREREGPGRFKFVVVHMAKAIEYFPVCLNSNGKSDSGDSLEASLWRQKAFYSSNFHYSLSITWAGCVADSEASPLWFTGQLKSPFFQNPFLWSVPQWMHFNPSGAKADDSDIFLHGLSRAISLQGILSR